jgi:hypothetical protein
VETNVSEANVRSELKRPRFGGDSRERSECYVGAKTLLLGGDSRERSECYVGGEYSGGFVLRLQAGLIGHTADDAALIHTTH